MTPERIIEMLEINKHDYEETEPKDEFCAEMIIALNEAIRIVKRKMTTEEFLEKAKEIKNECANCDCPDNNSCPYIDKWDRCIMEEAFNTSPRYWFD